MPDKLFTCIACKMEFTPRNSDKREVVRCPRCGNRHMRPRTGLSKLRFKRVL